MSPKKEHDTRAKIESPANDAIGGATEVAANESTVGQSLEYDSAVRRSRCRTERRGGRVTRGLQSEKTGGKVELCGGGPFELRETLTRRCVNLSQGQVEM